MLNINTYYNQPVTSKMYNDKIKYLLGSNMIMNGFRTVIDESNVVSVTPGLCVIEGAFIEETSDTKIVSVPAELLVNGQQIYIVLTYHHYSKSFIYSAESVSGFIKGVNQIIASQITVSISGEITTFNVDWMEPVKNIATDKDLVDVIKNLSIGNTILNGFRSSLNGNTVTITPGTAVVAGSKIEIKESTQIEIDVLEIGGKAFIYLEVDVNDGSYEFKTTYSEYVASDNQLLIVSLFEIYDAVDQKKLYLIQAPEAEQTSTSKSLREFLENSLKENTIFKAPNILVSGNTLLSILDGIYIIEGNVIGNELISNAFINVPVEVFSSVSEAYLICIYDSSTGKISFSYTINPQALLSNELIIANLTLVAGVVHVEKIAEAELAKKEWVAENFSNPNLLINSNFIRPINLNRLLTYVGTNIYTINNWRIVGNTSLTVASSSNGLTLTNTSNETMFLYQEIKNGADLQGKNITISADIISYSGACFIGFYDSTADKASVIAATGVNSYTEQISVSASLLRCVLYVNAGSSVTLKSVKAELGSVATPYVPKPYVEELQDCLMYDGETLTTPYSNPNLLINGDFQVWLNGTSFSTISSGYYKIYAANNWYVASNNVSTSNEKVKINGKNFFKQTFINCTGTTGVNVEHLLMTRDSHSNLSGKTVTFSALAKCNKNCRCIYIVYVVNGETSYKTMNIDSSNEFKIYSLTTTIPDYATMVGCGIGMSKAIDSTFNGTETVFGKCKLELGTIATPFSPKPYAQELQDCLMYDGETLTTPYSNPNLLINGGFDVWLNGTSFTLPGITTPVVNRWIVWNTVTSLTREINTSNAPCKFSAKVMCATIPSYNLLAQAIENSNLLLDKVVTLSFYARGIGGLTTLYSQVLNVVQIVTLTSSWQRFECTFLPTSISSVSIIDNGIKFNTSDDVLDSSKGYEIAGVKLEIGSVATPFVPKLYEEELHACLMYNNVLISPYNYSDVFQISPPYSNPNLLINGDFKVNQRGLISYTNSVTSTVYTVDRWFIVRASVAVSSSGVTLSPADASLYGILGTFIEEDFSNKMVTLSARVDGVTYTVSGMPNAVVETVQVITPFGVFRVFVSGSGYTYIEFSIGVAASPILIEWVKLELGSVATPFVPEKAPLKPLECYRYYLKKVLGRLMQYSANDMYFIVPIATPVRISPNFSSFVLISAQGVVQTGFTLYVHDTDITGAILFRAVKTAHGLTEAYLQVEGLDMEIY